MKRVTYPNKILRIPAAPIHRLSAKDQILIDKMRDNPYPGLAANQIGVSKRIISYLDNGDRVIIINPEITATEGSFLNEESCLSLILYSKIKVLRYEKIQVKGEDRDGNQIVVDAEGVIAGVIQHEIDHLNGILLIDHLSRFERNMYRFIFLPPRYFLRYQGQNPFFLICQRVARFLSHIKAVMP